MEVHVQKPRARSTTNPLCPLSSSVDQLEVDMEVELQLDSHCSKSVKLLLNTSQASLRAASGCAAFPGIGEDYTRECTYSYRTFTKM